MRLTLHAYADAEADAYADALIKKHNMLWYCFDHLLHNLRLTAG